MTGHESDDQAAIETAPAMLGICPKSLCDGSQFPHARVLGPQDGMTCETCGRQLIVYERVAT